MLTIDSARTSVDASCLDRYLEKLHGHPRVLQSQLLFSASKMHIHIINPRLRGTVHHVSGKKEVLAG